MPLEGRKAVGISSLVIALRFKYAIIGEVRKLIMVANSNNLIILDTDE